MKSIKINNMPDLPYAMEEAVNRLRINISFLGTKIKKIMIINIDNVINPSMLLESNRFEEMLAYMEEKYRYVFIDSPPLSLVSDGERIGNLCDGAILVVRGGVTSKHLVKNSIRQLERAGCPLLGIVLNRVEGAKSGYYSKRYGSKYYGGKYYNDAYYYGNH